LGPLGIEHVSHPDKECSLPDFYVLMARMKVRREPVTVGHRNQEGELAGAGGIAAEDGDERAGWQHGRHRPL
jgi:hypothetical protein